ncbi:MAG: DUF1576 domain-containing protein, partial [Defluviitaleaceae bacterium]|nr:DUF1576 domain-containing protein [Defluviitaleaceae bacterium]
MPYNLLFIINIGLIVLAFTVEPAQGVWYGFSRIITSRSILVTDYIAVGGVGAAFLNVGIVGIWVVSMLIRLGLKPGGANIMAVWLSMGFAFFGKNVFNMIPLTMGVWLYSKYVKQPFSQHYLGAILVATVSPTISELAFIGTFTPWLSIPLGVLMGFAVGFIFPVIATEALKTHSGFNLYNLGFAGGLVATVLAAIYKNQGHNIIPAELWSYGNNALLAGVLYGFALIMLLFGMFFDMTKKDSGHIGAVVGKAFRNFKQIHGHSGRLVTDFYQLYRNSIYINMAVLCAFGTTLVLVLGEQLNGPVLAGILTMTGFGALGKHMRNVVPVIAGTLLFDLVNNLDPSEPRNIVGVLFSTALAPIAGTFGWFWGVVAGFLHINIVIYIGTMNEGLNLYN